MAELLSVGLDVGTTTTQLILSRLKVQNHASSFAVPELEIAERQILYRSPVHFTPLLQEELVDGEGIRAIVTEEYRRAGIKREDVNTGAIIITGETSRKENAAAVLAALSEFAGNFVVATAGPELESVLAAKGAGATAWSEQTGKRVLHMDIGGGTSNLALIEAGKVTATACLDVGGRLLKFADGCITYRSPVLEGLTDLAVGDRPTEIQVLTLCRTLAGVLEMAAGLRGKDNSFYALTTGGTVPLDAPGEVVISFSGGVADCIERDIPWQTYGDMGPLLGRAIRESRLCSGNYRLGDETVRATVIGAGCYSTQLSGSTVYSQNVAFPLKNLPVSWVEADRQTDPAALKAALSGQDGPGVLALSGWNAPNYGQVTALADALAQAVEEEPCRIALRADMAKALGVALRLRLGTDREILCLDRLALPPNSYLDVGCPVGPAFPVVIKTLVLDS